MYYLLTAYVDKAMEELYSLLGRENEEQQLDNEVPEPMCRKMVKPVKEEAVKAFVSRYHSKTLSKKCHVSK